MNETVIRKTSTEARELTITGRVQGVGFRPFVLRLADTLNLDGWVCNEAGVVSVFVQGAPERLDVFARDVIAKAPPFARPRLSAATAIACRDTTGFRILESHEGRREVPSGEVPLPPDQSLCDDCRSELYDPTNRRHRYPFINCTQCGPRYTIIHRLPYDRPQTSMAGFGLCPECAAEYTNPRDRRFHAEPIACPTCGPRVRVAVSGKEVGEHDTYAAILSVVDTLAVGGVVAVKGIGGYHLLCDATSEQAVARLRGRKARPDKPLAVMVSPEGADLLDGARRLAHLTVEEAACLTDPSRPIVLVDQRDDAPVAVSVAPGLRQVGLMLPYSPLHDLIAQDFGRPLVATSGNLSGEPVLTDEDDADQRLAGIADLFLHHDRPILRPADDSVFRRVAGKVRPIRLGRGTAPLLMTLPTKIDRPTLALGGQMKVTVALAWDDRVAISPHLGDLGSLRSMTVLEQVVDDLQTLYGITARRVICDAHPHMSSRRWAERLGIPLQSVFHHRAHASALIGEHDIEDDTIVFTWDGVGYGEDRTLWGGEAFVGAPGRWRRCATFRPFALPGGDKASRQPWRSAASLCWERGLDWTGAPESTDLVYKTWRQRLNAPRTTAVGRLFDAAAALAGVVSVASFEGQGPMWLEALADVDAGVVRLPIVCNADGVHCADWGPLLPELMASERPVSERAGILHNSLAETLALQARIVRKETGVNRVGFAGGVFQNRVLSERARHLLEEAGFDVLMAEKIPCNDAGLSFGQIVETAAGDERQARL